MFAPSAAPASVEPGRASRRPLVSRAGLEVGLVALVVSGVVLTAVGLTGGTRYLLQGDGQTFRVVAANPFANGAVLRAQAWYGGDAYRYGRVLYPFLAWCLALGHGRWTTVTMCIVDALAVGACAMLASELCRRHGKRPQLGLLVVAVPAVGEGMGHLYSEPVFIALILAVYLLWADDRRGWAMVAGAALILTREAAALALVPLIVQSYRLGRRRELLSWAAVGLPYAAWVTWVRFRVGQWPFFDTSVSRRQALGAPVTSWVDVLRHGSFAAGLFPSIIAMAALTAITLGLAIYVACRRRCWPLSWGALSMGVLLVFLGPEAIRFPDAVLRLLGPTQVLILLSLIATAAPSALKRGDAREAAEDAGQQGDVVRPAIGSGQAGLDDAGLIAAAAAAR